LERVENVDGALEANRVDRSVRVAIMILHNLQNSRPFPFPRFSGEVLAAELRSTKRKSDAPLGQWTEIA